MFDSILRDCFYAIPFHEIVSFSFLQYLSQVDVSEVSVSNGM